MQNSAAASASACFSYCDAIATLCAPPALDERLSLECARAALANERCDALAFWITDRRRALSAGTPPLELFLCNVLYRMIYELVRLSCRLTTSAAFAQLLTQHVREKATAAPLRDSESLAHHIRCVLQSDAVCGLCYRLAAQMYMYTAKAFGESPGAALHCLLLAGEHSAALSGVRALKSQAGQSDGQLSSRRAAGRKAHKSVRFGGGGGQRTSDAASLRKRMTAAMGELSESQVESLLHERAELLDALAACPSADAARALLETGLCSLSDLFAVLSAECGVPLLTDALEQSLGHLGAVADDVERRADELLEAWRQLLQSPALALSSAGDGGAECLAGLARSKAFREWVAQLLVPDALQLAAAADAAFLVAQRAIAALFVHTAIAAARRQME